MQHLLILFIAVFLPVAGLSQSVPIVDAGYLTNVQGESNFIKNPNAQKNVSNVTSDDSSTITRGTTTPLSATSEFNLTDAGAWSAVFAARTFDSGMNGRQCEARVTVRGVAGTATLTVLDGSTVIGSVDVTPNATTSVVPTVYFPCGAPTTPKLKLSGSTAVTGTLEFGAAYMGPAFSTSAGTISTEWTSYTPTSSWNVGTSLFGKWRRVGDSMEVEAQVQVTTSGSVPTASLTVSIPSGFTIDTAKATDTTARVLKGTSYYYDISGTIGYTGIVRYATSTTVSVQTLDDAAASSHDIAPVTPTFPVAIANDDRVYLMFTVPISGWTATDIVTPEASLVEYASNSSATDANDTTSFVYGPAGSVGIIGTTNITADRLKRVRFPTAIKASDKIEIEVLDVVSNSWMPLCTNRDGTLCYVTQNGVGYGVYFVGVNSTDIDVGFARYAKVGTTFGGAGATWNATSGAFSWRVKKTPGTGNQSFYISSPVKTSADGTSGFKVKNQSGTDIVSIAEQGLHFTSSPTGNINSGTYTPTLTNVANTSALTPNKSMYTRVGNIMTFNVSGSVDAISTGITQFRITLPIASDLAATTECVGTGTRDESTVNSPISVSGDVANNEAVAYFVASYTAGAAGFSVNVMCEVK